MSGKDERDLDEVERALSVLGGRHPNQVRAEREAHEAAAKRGREHESHLAADRKRGRKRNAIAAVVLLLACGAGLAAWRMSASRAAIETEMAPLALRFTKAGFVILPRGTFAPQDRADVTTIAGDCYAFVAAGDAQMQIERPVGSAGAKGRAVVCTCASENVVVTSGGAPLRALHIAGNALGGSHALAYRFDDPPTAIAGDDACAEDALATFAREKRYGKQGADGAWLALHPALASSGFTTLATASEKLPYAFVEAGASRCFIASGTELTLWSLSESVQKPLHAKGAIAWCAAKEAPFIVERAGGGGITVVSASSKRIGGMIGLRELASHDGLAITTWVRDEERGEIAADALRASVVPDPVVVGSQTIEAAQTKDVRVLSFSTATKESFTSSEADFRCAPALGEPDALCVQLRALTWRAPPPGVVCGAAYGALPFWMSALADAHEPAAVDAELALIGFSRRMSARGFSPGVIEGVTERADSVEILGRSGDDAIVAVGLWPAPPFIHPYSDDVPWTLEDAEPRIIPLASGARVSLPVTAKNAQVPIEKRRTVVFRRQLSR